MDITQLLIAFAITFGWAVVGSLSMAIGLFLALKDFTLATREIDEWKLIKEGNMAMAIIIAAVILAVGYVVATVTRAGG